MLLAHTDLLGLFVKGGPIMWPLLATSIIACAVVLERMVFLYRERKHRDRQAVESVLKEVKRGSFDTAITAARGSQDFVARTLLYALEHRGEKLESAVLRAANLELKRYNRGLSALDTVVTLAPLLGLLGTVTGMIHAFGLVGADELGAPTAITGGIAEALIATAFGLCIAITALIPFNFLNTRLEEARHDIEDAASQLELFLRKKSGDTAPVEELVK
jgi:biopolymer transport protein ExbB